LAEAERHNDQGRKEGAQIEMERLTTEICHAVGLGGKRRKTYDDADKVRKNVSNAINRAITSIRAHHPAFADHLHIHIKRGVFFCYSGDGLSWEF
jgi:hypothetical protein